MNSEKEPSHENPQLAAKNAFDSGNGFMRIFGYVMAFLILSVVVVAGITFFTDVRLPNASDEVMEKARDELREYNKLNAPN